ncbi:hypothetical protein [Jiulongibacter sediminis]|uniref:DUF4595 domain-containing protein n=1 Tax=Jiulongibacter sediminis TaxID=1605367 RepID=A0A0N8H9Y9_9BACT|nr:hypothetical protein [Jiulongibacter sediminis]KPM48700.1 hypothetical protein AFM12_08895 [Jiulongibacter sediminis]TBX25235.1 hypothetical protein TK44_08900 [Jiulongibacter sediminis]
MKKLIPLMAVLVVIVACKDKKQDLSPETSLVSKITSARGEWNFFYDADLKMHEATYSYSTYTDKIDFFYNDEGQVDSSTTFAVGYPDEFSSRTFLYNEAGDLIRYIFSFYRNNQMINADTSDISLTEEGLLRIHKPGAEWGHTWFRYEGGNVKNSICFDCSTSDFDYTYIKEESFLPKKLRKYWNIYTGRKPIDFLSFLELGSENLLKDYFGFGPNIVPVALQNQYEFEPQSGNIMNVKTILTERPGYVVPYGRKAGDVWSVYEIAYSEF